ncbi:MAG: hypothetical protein GY804_11545 [Alphaproteobacteria bacterium]|nr:hypothetical protein [Alphaproteobacteria bacterium]
MTLKPLPQPKQDVFIRNFNKQKSEITFTAKTPRQFSIIEIFGDIRKIIADIWVIKVHSSYHFDEVLDVLDNYDDYDTSVLPEEE